MSVKKTQSKTNKQSKAKAKPVVPKDNQDRDAVEIGELWGKANQSLAEANAYYIECGKRLIAKKETLPHGQWLPWLKDHATVLGFKTDAANRMMRATNSELTLNLDPTAANRKLWGNDRPRANLQAATAEPLNSDLETVKRYRSTEAKPEMTTADIASKHRTKKPWKTRDVPGWLRDAVKDALKAGSKYGHATPEDFDPDILRVVFPNPEQAVASIRKAENTYRLVANLMEAALAKPDSAAPPEPMFEEAIPEAAE